MEFWSLDQLDLEDPINIEMWSRSAAEQDRIQPYRGDWQIGDVGAQQAMRFPHRLPWVPDPVGKGWDGRGALLVVGSAYGPFIGGDGRSHEIEPSEYACCSCAEFGRVFFEKVIQRRPYYARVAELASAVVDSCRAVALFDLCRVAFVRRALGRDRGGDGVVTQAAQLFTNYVESPTPNDWLWRRVLGSEASVILALGTIAEHGVLRLFARNLRDPHIRDSADPSIRFDCKRDDHKWPTRYADGRRKLRDRVAAPSPLFWQVEGYTERGLHRAWRVVVVPHPTGAWGATNSAWTETLSVIYHL
jgi:hypothetical protein